MIYASPFFLDQLKNLCHFGAARKQDLVKEESMVSFRKDSAIKEDLEKIKEEIFREFYVFYLRFTKEVNLIAGSQPRIIKRLRRIQNKLDRSLARNDTKNLKRRSLT